MLAAGSLADDNFWENHAKRWRSLLADLGQQSGAC